VTRPLIGRAAELVGRDAELGAIAAAVRHGRPVLVTGARGTGRSALLAEAARRHAPVLAVAALPGDEKLPGAGLQRLLTPLRAELPGLFDGTERRPDEIVGTVRRLAGETAGLWCVDDLDRLDELSRAAITGQTGATVLATAAGSGTAPGMRQLRLGPLGRGDAARLLFALPGVAAHAGARLALAQAGGNPLAITELAGHLPPGLPALSTELPVPPRLLRALAPHVRDLDPAQLRAALLAAYGSETPRRAVRDALDGLVPAEVWAGLVAAGVLRPGRGRRFTHPVVRAAVLDQAGPAQSWDLRHRLATSLPAGEPARAWHTARAEPAPDEQVAAVLAATGSRLTRSGRLRAAAYALAMAATRGTDPATARRWRRQAVESAHLAGESAWAKQIAAEAPAASEVAGTVETAELAPMLRRAWLRGDEPSLGAVRAVLGSSRSFAAELLSIWARAIATDEPVPGSTAAADPFAPDQRAVAWGTVSLARHRTGVAVWHLERARAIAPPDGLHLPMATAALAWAYLDRGDLTAARQRAGESLAALDPAARPGGPAAVLADIRTGALAALATIAELRQDPDRDDRVRDALAVLQPVGHALHDLRLVRAQGLAAGIQGRHELSFQRLRRLYHPDGRPVHYRASDLGLADLVLTATVLGRADRVAPLVEAAEPRIRALGAARTLAVWHRASALLAGQHEDAEKHFRLALADPEGDQWAFERALTRMDYAQWLRRRQRPGESRPLLGAARDTFAAAGLTAWRDRAEAELAAAAPPPRGRTAPGSQLTPQQHQVVLLAAQGLTNGQIGTRLGLSARTVGTHLSRAFAILGVTRRSQLPAAIGTAGGPDRDDA
jgi:DNA-binding CsgD family transcriptional regulator